MTILAVVFDVIIPVFGVLGVGYALARLDWFGADAARGLSSYTIRIAIPLMLFRGMAVAELPAEFPLDLLAAYFLAAYGMFAIGMLVAGGVFRQHGSRRGLFAFGCSYSNLMLIGIPLVLTAWGEDAVLPLFSIVACHTLLLFTPLTMILEADRTGVASRLRSLAKALLGLARNQYIVGIVAGLAWNLLALPLPGSIDSVLAMFAASATPCALFCVGASLARQRIAGEVPAAAAIASLKLVLFPLLVWLLGRFVFDLPALWLAVAVTVAAMPTGINIYLFAEQYRKGVALASTATVLGTAASVVTVTLVLTLLGVR